MRFSFLTLIKVLWSSLLIFIVRSLYSINLKILPHAFLFRFLILCIDLYHSLDFLLYLYFYLARRYNSELGIEWNISLNFFIKWYPIELIKKSRSCAKDAVIKLNIPRNWSTPFLLAILSIYRILWDPLSQLFGWLICWYRFFSFRTSFRLSAGF